MVDKICSLLEEGKSYEEIYKIFNQEFLQAQSRIKQSERLEKSKQNLRNAFCDYLIDLGNLKEIKHTDDIYDAFVDALEAFENGSCFHISPYTSFQE